MKTFAGFSEAARLYAENVAVVENMRRRFEEDMSEFFCSLTVRMQSQIERATICEEPREKYWSWWIEDEITKGNEDAKVPYVYVERRDDAEVIQGPRLFRAIVYIDGSDKGISERVASARETLSLPEGCNLVKFSKCFRIEVPVSDEDPVGIVAEPLLMTLKAIHEVEKAFMARPVR